MRRRSSSGSFEVQWRSTASASSSRYMPMPSSLTAIRLCPPSPNVTSMRLAPASIAFSTSSFTAAAGPLDHFAGGDAVDDDGRQLADHGPIVPAPRPRRQQPRPPPAPTSRAPASFAGAPTTTKDRAADRRAVGDALGVWSVTASMSRCGGPNSRCRAGRARSDERPGDAPGRIETQRERSREIGLGGRHFLGCRPIVAHALPLAADEGDRLRDMRVLGGDAANDEAAVLHRVKRAVDRIGEAALLAHLMGEARIEAAAAQDVIVDERGVPIGIVALQAPLPKGDDALRDGQARQQKLAGIRHLRLRHRARLGMRRQIAEGLIEQRLQLLRA